MSDLSMTTRLPVQDPVTLQNKGAYSTGETQLKRKWTEARKKILCSWAFFFYLCTSAVNAFNFKGSHMSICIYLHIFSFQTVSIALIP